MIFHFDRQQPPTPGKLLYIEDEPSLFFEEGDPLAHVQGGRDRTEISVGPVDLTVHLPTGKVLFASGYAPREGWRPGTVTPPLHRAGAVTVTGLDALPGMAVRVNARKYEITLDDRTGWLQVTVGVPTHQALAFAEGTVIGVDADGGLSDLWLKVRGRTSSTASGPLPSAGAAHIRTSGSPSSSRTSARHRTEDSRTRVWCSELTVQTRSGGTSNAVRSV